MRRRTIRITRGQLRNLIKEAMNAKASINSRGRTRRLNDWLFEDDDGGDDDGGDDFDDGGDDIGSGGEDTEGRMGAVGGSEDADSFDDAGSDMESRRAQMQARTDKAARDNDTRHQKDARGTRLSKERGGGGPKPQDMR